MINQQIFNIIKNNCLFEGNFTYADGSKGKYYLDLRKVFSNPNHFDLIIKSLYGKILLNIDEDNVYCLGLPTSGLCFASALSFHSKMPLAYCREKKKEYGNENLIEGELKSGMSCIIIDDVINSGITKRKTLEILKENHIECIGIFVVVDRRKDPQENFMNIPVYSLIKFNEILNILEE